MQSESNASPIVEVVEWFVLAAGGGMVGNYTADYVKATARRLGVFGRGGDRDSARPRVWRAAREHVLRHHGLELVDYGDRLPLAPSSEMTCEDGQWEVGFTSELGTLYAVRLGPRRRGRSWAESVASVRVDRGYSAGSSPG